MISLPDSFTADQARLLYARQPSEQLLLTYASHLVPEVRAFAASQMILDEPSASRFLVDVARVRKGLASNPTLSRSLQELLTSDGSWEVRAVLAASHRTETSLLERLAQDPVPEVRHALAGNPHLRMLSQIMESFLDSNDPTLVKAALRWVTLSEEIETRWMTSLEPAHHLALAGNHTLSAASQLRLAGVDDFPLRAALARNPALAPDAQERLIRGPHPRVGSRRIFTILLNNPALTEEAKALMKDPDIRGAAGPRYHESPPPGPS